MYRHSLAGLCALLMLAGCGGGSALQKAERASTYRQSLGSATHTDILREMDEVLVIRYAYRFQETRTTSADDIRFETEWKDQTPLPAEQEQGYSRAQTRITVTARARNRMGGSSESFSVQFFGEARMLNNGSWVRLPLTDARRDYFKDIAAYLQRELKSGVRGL